MKFDIVEMISEFAGLNQSPNFKPVSTNPDSEGSGHNTRRRSSNASVKSYNAARRGSLNIPVGVVSIQKSYPNMSLEKTFIAILVFLLARKFSTKFSNGPDFVEKKLYAHVCITIYLL